MDDLREDGLEEPIEEEEEEDIDDPEISLTNLKPKHLEELEEEEEEEEEDDMIENNGMYEE